MTTTTAHAVCRKLRFSPERVRELQRTATGLTCLMFFYYPEQLSAIEAERSAERLRRFAPLPKWRPLWEDSDQMSTLPDHMLQVRLESRDVAEIDAARRGRASDWGFFVRP